MKKITRRKALRQTGLLAGASLLPAFTRAQPQDAILGAHVFVCQWWQAYQTNPDSALWRKVRPLIALEIERGNVY